MSENLITLIQKYIGKKKLKSNLKDLFPKVGFFTSYKIKELEDILEIKIKKINYYEQAFSHRSLIKDLKTSSNQRLEFLGDAILGMIIGEYLFSTLPKDMEGELTKVRSAYVRNSTLAECATQLNLVNFIKFGTQAEKHLDKGFESMMSDVVEALVASIYFDRGMEVCREFVYKKLIPIMETNKEFVNKNYKSTLLEHFQASMKISPTYSLIEEMGPPHDKEFIVGVYINEDLLGKGKGKSKKVAEQNAALDALNLIKKD